MIVIHGNRIEHVPEAYRRYLTNVYRKRLDLWGTPIRIEFRGGDNPYKPTSTGAADPRRRQADTGKQAGETWRGTKIEPAASGSRRSTRGALSA